MINGRQGFSLIEVVAALAVSATMAALLIPLMGSSLDGSRRMAKNGPQNFALRSEMDAWWQLYRTVYADDLSGLSTALTAAAAGPPPPPYSVEYNGWVDFDSDGVELIPPPGTENVLRLTLANSEDEKLTAYFFPIPQSFGDSNGNGGNGN